MRRHTTPRAPRFDREWKEMIELLPEHRRAVMERAIREYQLSGSEPSGLEGAEVMAFMLVRKIVDRRARQRNARLRRMQSLTRQDCVTAAGDKPDDGPADKPHPTPRTSSSKSQNRQPKSDPARRHRPIVKRLNRLNPKR